MNPANTLTIWASGATRWHANRNPRLRHSGDCTDAHSARCARLLLCLKPDASAELIAAVLHHDVAETYTGDIPQSAKRENATLRDILRWMESDYEIRLGLNTPRNEDENAWVKLVDSLDAYLWVLRHDKDEARKPEWQDALVSLRSAAWALCVGQLVEAIIQEALE